MTYIECYKEKINNFSNSDSGFIFLSIEMIGLLGTLFGFISNLSIIFIIINNHIYEYIKLYNILLSIIMNIFLFTYGILIISFPIILLQVSLFFINFLLMIIKINYYCNKYNNNICKSCNEIISDEMNC